MKTFVTIMLMQPEEPVQETTQSNELAPETPDTSWQYTPEQEQSSEPVHPDIHEVEWTASEFVQHDKDASWFVAFGMLGIVIAGIIYFVTHDWVTVGVIIIAMALFAVAAKRKPRTLHYQINSQGVTIGSKSYPHAQFKSFTVLQEGAFNSIQLMPLKRFMPPISLYCPPEQEEDVIAALGNYLPHETRSHDPVDRLMSKIRF